MSDLKPCPFCGKEPKPTMSDKTYLNIAYRDLERKCKALESENAELEAALVSIESENTKLKAKFDYTDAAGAAAWAAARAVAWAAASDAASAAAWAAAWDEQSIKLQKIVFEESENE